MENIGNIANIIIAIILFIFFIRDIIVSITKDDHSNSKYWFVRWFFSSKEQVIAIHFLRGLGLNREKLKLIIFPKKSDYKAAIDILANCIKKADNGKTYKFGNDDRHSSPYYIDSQGYSQNRDNCKDLYEVILNLINKIDVDRDFDYVFSIKGGNIPLASAFTQYNYNIFSIMPKEKNEEVKSESNDKDTLINYEGLGLLIEKAKENSSKIFKGIAVTCNLSNGTKFLESIKKYNTEIEELKRTTDIPENIKKIENVYLLYRAISESKLDNDFEEAGLKCYRYFDLDDDLKAGLYSYRKSKEIDDFPCHLCIKKNIKHTGCAAKHCYKKI